MISHHIKRFTTSKFRLLPVTIRCTSSLSNEFLHRSILPTDHFQNALPRLPVPKLDDTLRRYVRSMEALEGHSEIDRNAIENTKRNITKFMQVDGPFLQQKLIEYDQANPKSSYLSKAWFDMYLESRVSVVLNYNPFLMMNPDPVNPQLNDQLLRATNMLYSSLKFKKTYESGILKPEVYYMKDTAKSDSFQTVVKYLPSTFKLRYLPMALNQAYPLDMSQYENIVCSTRIPQIGKDYLKKSNGKHMLVIHNGNLFTFNVLDSKGNIKPPAELYSSLKRIKEDKTPPPKHNVMYLTSEERDTWADLRHELVENGNTLTLHDIDSAIYCITLDDDNYDPENVSKMTENLLYGNGSSFWFDKSLTLAFSNNGHVGMNFEHSWGDGVAVLRFMHEVFDDSVANPVITAPTETTATDVKMLSFNLNDKLKAGIASANEKFHANTSRVKVSAKKYENLNKNYLKHKKVSPDGIMQLAIQIGHRRMYGHPAATYESCSTSAFKHGRTETLRSCTIEAQKVAKLISESGSHKIKNDASLQKEINYLIRESCNKHNQLTKEAAIGQGFDRHMFILKYIAERISEKSFTPALHQDNVYKVMNHFVLSTSTLASHAVVGGGFAPVVSDGFGVGYGVRDEFVGCNITSYENRDVAGLVDAIMESCKDIYTVLESTE